MSVGRWSSAEIGRHEQFVRCVAGLADPPRVVAADEDRNVRIWTIDGSAPAVSLMGHRDSVYDLVVLADGSIVSASWDGDARRWDQLGTCIGRFRCGRANRLTSVAADTTTSTLVCGDELGLVHEFDLRAGVVRRVSDLHQGRVRRIRFIVGSWWSVGDDGRVLRGEPGGPVVVQAALERPTYDLAGPATDGSVLVIDADGAIHRLGVDGSRECVAVDGAYLRSIAVGPDPDRFAIVGTSGRIWVIEGDGDWRAAAVAAAPTPLLDVAWLDPASLAVVGRDGTVGVVTGGGGGAWRYDGLDGHADHVFGLAALAADRFATAGFDGRVLCWEHRID
jgi:WD40 repeat protein